MNKTPERIQVLLRTIVEHFDKEDNTVRERQIRKWRQLKLMWEGFQRTWYSEVAHDWRIADEVQDDNSQSYYDKPINVFKAYLESIIAALSISIPPIKCFPDDANNPLDLLTAKAGDKISQLVYRHNDISLLWLHALFIFCTEGLVACYSYPKEDKSYGTYDEKKYEDVNEEHQISTCPNCGMEMNDQIIQNPDEFMPSSDELELCEACQQLVQPNVQKSTLVITRLVGITKNPKSRQCLEAYGGLFVKVPNYAMNQESCPYLIYSHETHYANVLEKYEHLKDKIGGKEGFQSGGLYDPYERWGRLPLQYFGEYPTNVVTVRQIWLRPCAFNVLADEKDIRELKKRYPDGVKVVFVNDDFAEAVDESLDDCWTLTRNPLSDYIHHEPLGSSLTSIQEITNDLISLVIQTIEHGIPQTFADPAVLDFNQYRQTEVAPGNIFPAKPKSGKSVSDGFYEVKTSTLSQEVLPFFQQTQQLGQLASGSTPSIFGGQLEGSNTASEYSMSRAQALQRLQNTWKIFTVWWKTIFGKVIPAYIKNVKDDERDVQQDKNGNFVNVLIRRAELEGKIGKIELEASENLPITWSQTKDVVMKMIESANPEVLAILGDVQNLPVIREAIGLTDFFVPGEDDRTYEYEVIKQLLNSEPIQSVGPDGMPTKIPSVEVEPEIENNEIGFEVCRSWLISEEGQLAKNDNPAGYENVLLRAKMHLMLKQQAELAQIQTQPETGAAPGEKTNPAPIDGVNNVSTIQ